MKHLTFLLAATAFAAITLSSCNILEPGDPGQLVPRTVDEDSSLPSIAVNGTQLHAETFGNPGDPMIVVLHDGPGGDYRALLNLSKFAADGFYVVFYDQRGSGLSRRHNKETYTVDVFTDDLAAVIAHFSQGPNQKVILMGESWGAMLATAYINKHPADISGAVLIEPGGLTWHDAEDYIKRCRSLSVFDETSNDFVYVDQFITGSDHIMLDYRAALQKGADFAKGNKMGNPGPYPFWRCGAVCNSAAMAYAKDHPFDFTTNLRQFSTRVLFVYSELNQAYGKAYAQKVSSAYPNVEMLHINSSGHQVPYFGWDEFYPAARTYLTSVK